MLFQVGDIVTRNSYHNDTYFVIMEITGNIAYLKGIKDPGEMDKETFNKCYRRTMAIYKKESRTSSKK